jgi:5-methylthioadenosine/S-adenosylhomocysteine deaminase
MCAICRRSFLRGTAGLAAASGFLSSGLSAFAQAGSALSGSRAAANLPARGDFVIRNAYVMTMDPQLGDIPNGSVHIRNGFVAAVGTSVDAPGAAVIDGQDRIVLPGLIDTHWHMWHTLFRGLSGDKREEGFFPTVTRFSGAMTAEDMYQSTRLAAAEGLNAGITTVHSWCHNIRSRAHAEADIRAINDVGLRGRWSFGQAIDQPGDQTIRLADLEALHRDWGSYANERLLSLGMAWRGIYRGNAFLPTEVYKTEFDTARRLGIPITVHIGTVKTQTAGHIEGHARQNLLGPDVNIVHGCSANAAEIRMVKDSGASISILPHSEMRGGWGFPLLGEFMEAGVPVGLGVDTNALVGDTNLFAVMKFAVAVENARGASEFKLSARRALELGTIDAARVLGLDSQTGSLKVGKRADLIAVATDQLNMGLSTDAAHTLVECTQPANVETVVVDGRILKQAGKLTALQPAQIVREARTSLADIRKRANWR